MIIDPKKPLTGQSLSALPLDMLSLSELAQVYCYFTFKHGEDSPYAFDVLEELNKRNKVRLPIFDIENLSVEHATLNIADLMFG